MGNPVQFISVPEVVMPRRGVTRVGLVDNTTATVPVLVVTPVPPRATGNVLMGPPSIGKPVQFVSTPDVGVPRRGAMRVGVLFSTTDPVPVLVVTPVPPCVTASVPIA